MQEILTPVQYEPALDVLNRINKLYIDKKASLSIDLMQASKNPVGVGQPIIGKFIKQDNQGAICTQLLDAGFKNYEYIYIDNLGTQQYMSAVFSQQVYGVLVRAIVLRPLDMWVYWISITDIPFKLLPHNVNTWCPLNGTIFRMWGQPEVVNYRAYVYGFY